MADFTGFYFNGIHSSTYHLIRTSHGDRYEDILFPEFDDRTVELVGGHGNIYDSTRYKEKEFSVSVAFDSVTEQDLRDIKRWLEPNKIQEFRFDEVPYKTYWAKLKSPPKFEYICFMAQKEDSFLGDKERIYKGETTLDFIAYNPFGYCCDKSTKITENGLEKVEDGINWQVLDSYNPFSILDDNIVEWASTSGLMNKTELEKYNTFGRIQDSDTQKWKYIADLYNPGDFEADFELFFDLIRKEYEDGAVAEDTYPNQRFQNYGCNRMEIKLETGTETKYFSFFIKDFNVRDRILLDTKKHALIRYVSSVPYSETNKPTSNQIASETFSKELRYDQIERADWFKIPKGYSKMTITSSFNASLIDIKYNYKYY